MNYKSIIETAYNRAKWQTLLHDIFGKRADFYAPAHRLDLGKSLLKESWFLGAITLSDGQKIGIYEGELADSVKLERNRVSVRELFTTEWRSRGFAGAFQFCYKTGASEIRFSYVSETWAFDKEGAFRKESTDTRRFTYFLGEGHRSRTAIQQFEELKRSDLTLADITKAFSVEAKSRIDGLVQQVLVVKKENPDADTSALESEIDQLVYKLYGLTPEEIAVVEAAVPTGGSNG